MPPADHHLQGAGGIITSHLQHCLNPEFLNLTELHSTAAHCLQAHRFPAWKATLQYVRQHRTANELHSWSAGLTEWADWTDDEFRAALLGQVTHPLNLDNSNCKEPLQCYNANASRVQACIHSFVFSHSWTSPCCSRHVGSLSNQE